MERDRGGEQELAEDHISELEKLNKLRSYFQPAITMQEAANLAYDLNSAGYTNAWMGRYVGVTESTITYLINAYRNLIEEAWSHVEEYGWALQKTYYVSRLEPDTQRKILEHERDWDRMGDEAWLKYMGVDFKYPRTPIKDGDLVEDSSTSTKIEAEKHE